MRCVSKLLTGSLLTLGLMAAAPLASAQNAAQTAAQQKNAAAAAARKQMTEAQNNVKVVKDEQKRLKDKLLAEFEAKEEWKNTAATHKKATAAYDKAKKDAMRALLSKPEYKKVVQEQDAARAKQDELIKSGSKDADAIAKAGTDLAVKGTARKKLEADAVANDEKVLAAKETFELADKEMKALNDEVEGALSSDPDYVAVLQQVEQAEAQVKQLRDQQLAQRKSEQQSRPRPAPRAPKGESADY